MLSSPQVDLHRGEIVIVFDLETKTSNIVLKDELRLRRSTSVTTSDVAGDPVTSLD